MPLKEIPEEKSFFHFVEFIREKPGLFVEEHPKDLWILWYHWIIITESWFGYLDPQWDIFLNWLDTEKYDGDIGPINSIFWKVKEVGVEKAYHWFYESLDEYKKLKNL